MWPQGACHGHNPLHHSTPSQEDPELTCIRCNLDLCFSSWNQKTENYVHCSHSVLFDFNTITIPFSFFWKNTFYFKTFKIDSQRLQDCYFSCTISVLLLCTLSLFCLVPLLIPWCCASLSGGEYGRHGEKCKGQRGGRFGNRGYGMSFLRSVFWFSFLHGKNNFLYMERTVL